MWNLCWTNTQTFTALLAKSVFSRRVYKADWCVCVCVCNSNSAAAAVATRNINVFGCLTRFMSNFVNYRTERNRCFIMCLLRCAYSLYIDHIRGKQVRRLRVDSAYIRKYFIFYLFGIYTIQCMCVCWSRELRIFEITFAAAAASKRICIETK